METDNKNSGRYHLIPLTSEHLSHIAQWYEDIDDLSMIESKLPVPINAQSLEKLWQQDLSQTEPRTCYMFTICDDNNEPVGYTGLQDINYAHGNGVVFIYVKKELRKKGLGIRAIALMLDLSFLQLRLHRITTYVFEHNQPSLALIKRSGFVEEGRMRQACFFDGDYRDLVVVGMLKDEWAEPRRALSSTMSTETVATFGQSTSTRWSWPPGKQTNSTT